MVWIPIQNVSTLNKEVRIAALFPSSRRLDSIPARSAALHQFEVEGIGARSSGLPGIRQTGPDASCSRTQGGVDDHGPCRSGWQGNHQYPGRVLI